MGSLILDGGPLDEVNAPKDLLGIPRDKTFKEYGFDFNEVDEEEERKY